MAQASTVKRATKAAKSQSRFEAPGPSTSSMPADFKQKVEKKAYELFLARGCAHGFDVEDWLAAEQIVKGD